MLHRASAARKIFWLIVALSALIFASVHLLKVYEPKEFKPSGYLVREATSNPRPTPRGAIGTQHSNAPTAARSSQANAAATGTAGLETQATDGAARVYIGVYNDNNYNDSVLTPSYSSTGFLWMRWGEDFQKILDRNGVKPGNGLINIVNEIYSWDTLLSPVSEAIKTPTGDYYQQFNYDLSLYIDNLDLRRYPFSSLNLPIDIELNDPSNIFRFEDVRLVPDLENSAIGNRVELDGYILEGWQMDEFRHHYPTSFGLESPGSTLNGQATKGGYDYSQIVLAVNYVKSIYTGIWDAFLPLIVTLMIVMLSPSLASKLWEVRIAIPTTVLLTLVFLQQGYRANLPELSYLTYLDEIYSIAFIVTLVSFLQFMWGSNLLAAASHQDEPAVIERINKVDFIVQAASVLLLVLGSLLCWLL